MQSIFSVSSFAFPYLYKFPGQASDERILFVTRESPVMLWLRWIFILVAALFLVTIGSVLAELLASIVGFGLAVGLQTLSWVLAGIFTVLGGWWVTVLWRRSICLVTTKRLAKFIYTTPWNRHNLSLPLDMVVDTGAYSKGFVQAVFGLGTFTARSSASSSGSATDDVGRINKKYFYIENVHHAEDLHHYLNKVLFAYRQDWAKLATFRPFLPELKGDARKDFMQQFPEYWS